MLFGKTSAEKLQSMYDEALTKASGIEMFAWKPTKLTNGQWVWFDFYWEYWDVYQVGPDGGYSTYEFDLRKSTTPKKSTNYNVICDVLPRRYMYESEDYRRFYTKREWNSMGQPK